MRSPKALTPDEVVDGAVGPFDDYCDGYGNPGASGLGYVCVLKLSTGTVAITTDTVLQGIASFDRAARNDAYAGQINMIAASSFSGLNGAVWGYDLARHDGLTDGSIKPVMMRERHDGAQIPVLPVAPLLEAGERLFGAEAQRRFPLLPGAHVACATKDITAGGPTSVWSAIALAVAEDRERDASLFIEDAGHDRVTHADRESAAQNRMASIVDSVILCGADQDVKFREIFIGFKQVWVPEGHVGCALTCAPYLVLAKNAVPDPASRLLSMSLSQWEARYAGAGAF
ncbi:MAG: histidine decarboxylase, pyruvoyl type [Streptosporangiaceae bacterium]